MRYLDQIRELEKQAAAHHDQVKGGLADKKQPKELPQGQLRMGEKVEREHTKDPAKAKEIAMDHLVEDERYYTKLRKMEKKSSHQCRKCGKTHRPKCDRCGATTDLRSYHGPCGKCAFRGKEKKAMLEAFVDELEKISESVTVDSAKLRTTMQELAGEASMAWGPRPSTQVFDPDAALRAVDGALARLKTKTAKQLTTKARKKLPAKSFVFPKEKRYPIHDAAHARNALARASGKPEEAKVRAAVRRRYPGIGKTAGWLDRKFQEAGKSVATGAAGELKQHAKKYIPHAIAAGVAIPAAMGAASYYGSKRGVKAAIREASRPEKEKTAVSAKTVGTAFAKRVKQYGGKIDWATRRLLNKNHPQYAKWFARSPGTRVDASHFFLTEMKKTAVSEQWVQNKVLGAAGKARKPLNLLGREKLQDFADRVVRKSGTMTQRDRRHIAGTTALHVLNSGRAPLKAAAIVKTAVSTEWIHGKLRGAEAKAGQFWNTKGREKLEKFHLGNLGAAVWGPKHIQARREAVANAVRYPKANLLDKAQSYLPKLAGKRAFSSVFRSSKRDTSERPEDTVEVKPRLNFVERHPKAFYGSLVAVGALGAGALVYRNSEAAKKFVSGLYSKKTAPPAHGKRFSPEEIDRAIDKMFGVSEGSPSISSGVNPLMQHKKNVATNPPTPPNVPHMKPAKSTVTNVDIPTAPKNYGSLGEKLLKVVQQGASESPPPKKMNRAMRRQLEHAARNAKPNPRG